MNDMQKEPSSYKDYDAQVFMENGICKRQINKSYFEIYDSFMENLYEDLLQKNLIIPHKEVYRDEDKIIIEPEQVFISYPWEWSFSQLKDVALSTLKIQKCALKKGFCLKDANCFNVQFYKNNPVLIDTTSFEIYKEGESWVAYRQFCQNFLAPLFLQAYTDLSLNSLFLSDINGISLGLASKLLPVKTYFDFNALMHIHMHSKLETHYSDTNRKIKKPYISKNQMLNLTDNLIQTVKKITLPKGKTQWGNYYSFTNYDEQSFQSKKNFVNTCNERIKANTVVDFGANDGTFSRLFNEAQVFSLDFDRLAVEYNYEKVKQNDEKNILPLIFDIINPSPGLGFNNEERKSLISRIKGVDLAMALALIHHLRLTYNLPFWKIASFFASVSNFLIIEYVDKQDSQIQKMLLNREDIFWDYTNETFENEFSEYYNILQKEHLPNTHRILYLMEKK